MSKKIVLILAFVIAFYTNSSAESELHDGFYNTQLLDGFLIKLHQLEKTKQGKVNIVHIGDSHIQADLLTNEIRQELQAQFGNGGLGFTFPYKLIKTNSNHFVKYSSNQPWQNAWNIKPSKTDVAIGLSGIAFYTKSKRFSIELKTDSNYVFNKIKLLYPSTQPSFDLSFVNPKLPIIHAQYAGSKHKIKSGETLSGIAAQYHVSVKKLMEANHLKNSRIAAGKTLIIPEKKIIEPNYEKQALRAILPAEDLLPLNYHNYEASFTSDSSISSIHIIPRLDSTNKTYNLSGIVLENDQAGIIYHSIGVNGAKASDFNKYPLFYNQLSALHPDAVILSFGTNESFGKLSPEEYLSSLQYMIRQIKKKSPDAVIIVTTPSPSFIRKKYPNRLVAEYSKELRALPNVVVWDLFEKMGGINAKAKDLQMGKLKIHYTQDGYTKQGERFVLDLLNAYNEYE